MKLQWYFLDGSHHIDLTCYSDADFAGYKVDRNSTSGTCHFLGHSLVSRFSKKQKLVELSITKVEYIATNSCCAQALWMKQTLRGYGINLDQVQTYRDLLKRSFLKRSR